MIVMVRAALVIGAIAWFSPVHEQSVDERLAVVRQAPGDAARAALRHAPAAEILASQDSRQIALRMMQATVHSTTQPTERLGAQPGR